MAKTSTHTKWRNFVAEQQPEWGDPIGYNKVIEEIEKVNMIFKEANETIEKNLK